MQVKFYASLRALVGSKFVEVELPPDPTIGDVLAQLAERYPQLRERLFTEAGELTAYVHVFVNGENIRHAQCLQTPIRPEDSIDIFPPVTGGRDL